MSTRFRECPNSKASQLGVECQTSDTPHTMLRRLVLDTLPNRFPPCGTPQAASLEELRTQLSLQVRCMIQVPCARWRGVFMFSMAGPVRFLMLFLFRHRPSFHLLLLPCHSLLPMCPLLLVVSCWTEANVVRYTHKIANSVSSRSSPVPSPALGENDISARLKNIVPRGRDFVSANLICKRCNASFQRVLGETF